MAPLSPTSSSSGLSSAASSRRAARRPRKSGLSKARWARYEPKIDEIREWLRTARNVAKPYEPRWVARARNSVNNAAPLPRFQIPGSRVLMCEGPGWLLLRQELGAPAAPGPVRPDNGPGSGPSSTASEAADMEELDLPDLINSMSIS